MRFFIKIVFCCAIIGCSLNSIKFNHEKLNILCRQKEKVVDEIKSLEDENIKIENSLKITNEKIKLLKEKIEISTKLILKYCTQYSEYKKNVDQEKQISQNKNVRSKIKINSSFFKKKYQSPDEINMLASLNKLNIEKEKILEYKEELEINSKKLNLDSQVSFKNKIKENEKIKKRLAAHLEILEKEIAEEKIRVEKISLLNKQKIQLQNEFNKAKNSLEYIISDVTRKLVTQANLSPPKNLQKFKKSLLKETSKHSDKYFREYLKKLNIYYLDQYQKNIQLYNNKNFRRFFNETREKITETVFAISSNINSIDFEKFTDDIKSQFNNFIKEIQNENVSNSDKIKKKNSLSSKNVSEAMPSLNLQDFQYKSQNKLALDNMILFYFMITIWFCHIKEDMQVFLSLHREIDQINKKIKEI